MDPVTIATLIANLLPSLLQLYSEIEQQYTGQVKPLQDILAAADANWESVQATAQAEIAKDAPAS